MKSGNYDRNEDYRQYMTLEKMSAFFVQTDVVLGSFFD